mgnify:FL=1|jgi:hypothetical protein
MIDKNKPHIKLNLNRELSFELKYGIQNNILHLDVPIENSEKTITVNFEIIDILGRDGFDIKKMFVNEIKNAR